MHRVIVIVSIILLLASAPFVFFLFQQQSSRQVQLPRATPEELSPGSAPQDRAPQNTAIFTAEKLYLLINAYRKEKNLTPLKPSPELETSSHLKIKDMIAKNYWQHADPNNVESWPFFKQAGYEYEVAGENLSFAINSAWGVFSSWVQSPTHNEQLVTSKYEEMGVSIDCTTYADLAEQPCIVVLHLGKQQR
jgi:uncharacterized protein YkwD